jgi:two-component system, NtrC family, sensor kinase
MPTAMLSIRQKVLIAVAALYMLLAASVLGSYYFVNQLEDKTSYLEDLSKLEESVLETRRFEKNYFLYGDQKSLDTALYHITRVNSLLNKNLTKIETLTSHERVVEFARDFAEYEGLLQACSAVGGHGKCLETPETQSEYEARIRKVGTKISEFAESAVRQKRQSIKETMEAAVRLQLFVFAVVAVGFTVHGGFLFSKVLKPMRLLEESTASIARGEFRPIQNLPPEKEIREIFDSFNRMAERLRTREEQLVQSKKLASLGTMLAGVAHEVNNPLSNISSSCEILLEELENEDKEWQKTMLRKVLEQVDKARGIVLNLLEFSRNKDFSKERFNLKQVFEKTLSLLHGQIPSGVRVLTEIDDELRIFADKQRIQQALMNLISNAAQAIEGEGTVRIRAHKDSDGVVRVIIRDTGRGISEEDLPRIFDPFFTTKDVGQGTGLGLFITHDIILRHQGTIRVKSTLGKGTTMAITLPAEEPKT